MRNGKGSAVTVHWVSPLPPAPTDIGHYTLRIIRELSASADVVVWTDAEHWDSELESICRVRRLDPDRIVAGDFGVASSGKSRDAVFIHIGNSWVHHSGFLRLAHRVPSVLVLHDFALQELFVDAVQNGQFPRPTYQLEMARWYGEEGYRLSTELLAGRVSAYGVVADMPGFECALGRSVSVLCHTSAGLQRVARRGLIPCYGLDLPFKAGSLRGHRRSGDGPLRLAQFGYIGPNRRLEQILEALGELVGRIDFDFRIFGHVWDTERIERLIDKLGLRERARIVGFVDEITLDEELSSADLVFNLRYPTMGEASGSQLRIWNASAASIVSDEGWYRDLPKDSVFIAPVVGEKEFLKDTLVSAAEDRELLRKMGENGRRHLTERHQPERYVQGILEIAQRFDEDVSSALITRALSGLFRELGPEGSTIFESCDLLRRDMGRTS
jgi:glycosyltransferase involved in cell wall biosynthesis